ncbi:hypothetical protein B9479_008277 [Cryptococcus floricola]|uniref:Uncharacterized protein n=1 Tax=Cryptococcus floricola TaxID=2591691 RepID=A0A5D3AHW1_9TREE|nr:hypothetical protein B9479_008277 [Cryptococcus floricola]
MGVEEEDRKTLKDNDISYIDAKGTCFRTVTDFDMSGAPIGSRDIEMKFPAIAWDYPDGSRIGMAHRDALSRARVRALNKGNYPSITSGQESDRTRGRKKSRGRTQDNPTDRGKGSSSTAAATMSEDDPSLSYEIKLPEEPTIADGMTAADHALLGHGTEPCMFSDGTMMYSYPAEGGPYSVPYNQAYHDSFQQQQQ